METICHGQSGEVPRLEPSPLIYKIVPQEDVEQLYRMYPDLPKTHMVGCPSCGKNLGQYVDGMVVVDGVQMICNCQDQLQRHKHYLNAGIGANYQYLNWHHFVGDQNAKDRAWEYVVRLHQMVESGIGLFFQGEQYGVGKAQPLDALVLTPDGFVAMGDISVGDKVVGGDGSTRSVVGVFPQGEKPVCIVRLKDGRTVECCEEHLWKVYDVDAQKHRVLSLNEIDGEGLRSRKSKSSYRFRVPLSAPVERPSADLPVDPYVLGVLIGDGCLSCGTSVVVSSNEEDVMDMLADRLGPDYCVKKYNADSYSWGISYTPQHNANPLRTCLVEMGLRGKASRDKFIPKCYINASIEQRRELLAGLMDTDGHVDKKGHVSYSTVSKALVDDVVELARSLGIAVTYSGYERRRGGRSSIEYIVRFHTDDRIWKSVKHDERFGAYRRVRMLDSDSSPIVSVERLSSMKRMQCIMLDDGGDHTYITDGYVVTHNTMLAALVLKSCVMAGYRCYMTTFANMLSSMKAGWKNPEYAQWYKRRVESAQILLLDDVGKELMSGSGFNNDYARQVFDDTMRTRVQDRLPTFITTNFNEQTISQAYGEAVFSLITEQSMAVKVTGSDYRKTMQKFEKGRRRIY